MWTEDNINIINTLWPTTSATKIASIISRKVGFRVSRNAVIGKATRLGIKKKKQKTVTTLGEEAVSILKSLWFDKFISRGYICHQIFRETGHTISPEA